MLVSGDFVDRENEISDSYQSIPRVHGVSGKDCAINECSVMGKSNKIMSLFISYYRINLL